MNRPARIPPRPRSGRTSSAAVAGAALALLTLAGCAPVADVRGNWHLVTGSDSAGDLRVGDELVTMLVKSGSFSGRGPCNDYSGQLPEQQGPGMLASVTATSLGCPNHGDLETRYFRDLAEVSSLRVENGHLVAAGSGGVRLEFAERSRG